MPTDPFHLLLDRPEAVSRARQNMLEGSSVSKLSANWSWRVAGAESPVSPCRRRRGSALFRRHLSVAPPE